MSAGGAGKDVEHARWENVLSELLMKNRAVSGVWRDGLSTTQSPAASAGASFKPAIRSGSSMVRCRRPRRSAPVGPDHILSAHVLASGTSL